MKIVIISDIKSIHINHILFNQKHYYLYITIELYNNTLDYSDEADVIFSPEVTSLSSSLPEKKKIKRSSVSAIAPVANPIATQQTLVPAVKAAILPKAKKIVKERGGTNDVAVIQSGLKLQSQIIWIVSLHLLLLEIVIQVDAHLASGKATAIKWCEVHAIFFDSEECIQYKSADFYKKDDYRKLRDKFIKLMKATTDDINTGNQSGKTEEMSKVYELVN